MLKKILFGSLGLLAIILVVLFFVLPIKTNTQGTVISFNKGGNVSEYAISGFSWPESDFTWTDGKEALITIPTQKKSDKENLALFVDAEPFLYKNLKKQNVDVFANDVLIAKWNMEKPGIYSAILPQDINGDVLKIKFKINNPKSPKELKLSNDARKLGFATKRMVLLPVNAKNTKLFANYKIDEEVSFKADANQRKYLGEGWSFQEQKFIWTDGSDAYINLFIDDAENKSLQFMMTGKAAYALDVPYQKIIVYVNGKELATWNAERERNTYSVKIPESVVGDGLVQIRLHIEKPVVVKPDTRKLGFALENIRIKKFFAAKTKIKIANWIKNSVLKNVEPVVSE